ncbi:MAG: hypothetical protein WC477_06630 [Patescibacteria group bacterium]
MEPCLDERGLLQLLLASKPGPTEKQLVQLACNLPCLENVIFRILRLRELCLEWRGTFDWTECLPDQEPRPMFPTNTVLEQLYLHHTAGG